MTNKKMKQQEGTRIRRSTLLLLGYLLLAMGMFGRGVLETRLLGVKTGTGDDLLRVLEMSGGMAAAGTALFFEAMELCAVPIFAVLTVDGFLRTGDIRCYILRVGAVALIGEIPYNLAIGGTILDPSARNPVFGTLLCLIMLYLYRQFAGREPSRVLGRLLISLAALVWAAMFRIDFGIMMILIVDVLWIMRERPALKEFMAAAVALCCCVANPLAMFAPFGFLLTHWYRGEKGYMVRGLQYAMYPLLLLLTGAAGLLLF